MIAALAGSLMLHISLGWVATGGSGGPPRQIAAPAGFQISLIHGASDEAAPTSQADDQRTVTTVTPELAAPTALRPLAAQASASAAEKPLGSSAVLEGPDPTYYPAKQLDVYPALVSELDLRALNNTSPGSSARAQLLVLIDEGGVVSEVSIIEGEPPSRFEAARRALLVARFTPAYRNGRAVKSRVLIEVNIVDDGAGR